MRPELVDRYVEKGTLRIEWRDFPYQGQESVNAALAARAAQEQGKFWEYNRLLFENQGGTNGGAFSEENLLRFARELNLDLEEFEADLKTGEHEAAVNADFREGQRLGIAGTPTFIINGRVIVGLQSIEVFERMIEESREEADGG